MEWGQLDRVHGMRPFRVVGNRLIKSSYLRYKNAEVETGDTLCSQYCSVNPSMLFHVNVHIRDAPRQDTRI